MFKKISRIVRLRRRLAKGDQHRIERRRELIELRYTNEVIGKLSRELNKLRSRVENWDKINPGNDSRQRQVTRYGSLVIELWSINTLARNLVGSTIYPKLLLKVKIEEGPKKDRRTHLVQLQDLEKIGATCQKIATGANYTVRELADDLVNHESDLGNKKAEQVKQSLDIIITDLKQIIGWTAPYAEEIKNSLKRSKISGTALFLGTARKLKSLRKKFMSN